MNNTKTANYRRKDAVIKLERIHFYYGSPISEKMFHHISPIYLHASITTIFIGTNLFI